MSLYQELLASAKKIEQALPTMPEVTGLYLPEIKTDGIIRDEFGFVFLDSGIAAPFYVSLDQTLSQLWQQYPQPLQAGVTLAELLQGLLSSNLIDRALGLGAYNALSQHVMRLAKYVPVKRSSKTDTKQKLTSGPVGMVGYFEPLVERLAAKGTEVVVLEHQQQRILPNPLVTGVRVPEGLASCTEVICTASTLINDSLDEIKQACVQATQFNLIGPTSSGLPDVVFAHGVDMVGSSSFTSVDILLPHLQNNESWGKLSSKYEIHRDDYPGLEVLLEMAIS